MRLTAPPRLGLFLRVAAAVAVLGGAAWAEPPDRDLPSVSTLKSMTIDQLLDLDVTSVTRSPERLFGTASAIQVITAEDIRRSGATRLPEALRLASNVEVAQIDSRQWAITARGYNNVFADKMLVQIDGRSVYTPLYAGVYWDVQDTPLFDLDRIEVISGPGATQWGANAVNGVINITTKSAKDTQGGLLTGGVGTELRQNAAVRYGGHTARGVYYRVYASYFDRSDSVRMAARSSGEPVRSNDAWRMIQGGFRADWDGGAADAFTLQGDGYNGSMGQVGPDNIRVNGANLLGRWTRALANAGELKLQLYFDHTHRRIPRSFTQDVNTWDLDFQHRLPLYGLSRLSWGLGYRLAADDVVNTPANAFLPPQVTRQWVNLFLQDEITLVPRRLHVVVGTKFEHNDYTGFEVEPSARLAYTPSAVETYWAAVSRAVRTPSRVDRDLYSPATPPYRIAGSPAVVSERLVAYELGYRRQLAPSLIGSVATYYHDYRNLRSLDPITPPLAFPAEASSGFVGYSTGAELTVDWRVATPLRLRAGYTEMRVHSAPDSGSRARGTRDTIVRDPNRQFSVRAFWDVSRTWELDTLLRYVGPITNQQVPGYAEADVRLGWTPSPAWEFSIVGQNLLHAEHAEFNAPSGRREIQRGVHLKAAWRF